MFFAPRVNVKFYPRIYFSFASRYRFLDSTCQVPAKFVPNFAKSMSACVGAVVKDKIITSLTISLHNEISLFLVVLVWVPPQAGPETRRGLECKQFAWQA